MEKSEMYKFAEFELDKLLEIERKNNLNVSIDQLEHEVELFDGKTMQEYINDQILEVIDVLSKQHHSGSSMSYLMEMVNKLVSFENITPLTLTPDEFEEVARTDEDGIIYQNKRNFKVFKTDAKGVYHLDGQAALDEALGKVEGEDENE